MEPAEEKHWELFTQPGSHPVYEHVRTSEWKQTYREEVERMYREYKPFCPDRSFPNRFRSEYYARLWEIHLANAFLDQGHKLRRTTGADPDLFLENEKIWVEAVTASPGSGANRVYDAGPGIVQHFREDQIILRLVAAINKKREAISRYQERGIIHKEDPTIIALNSSEIGLSNFAIDPNIPMIIKALFPIGKGYFRVPVFDEERTPPTHHYEIIESRTSANNAQVRTDCFLADEFKAVSAVIFCPYCVLNSQPAPYGRNFVTIHNPKATVPIPRGTFKFGKEFWVEPDERGALCIQPFRDWTKS